MGDEISGGGDQSTKTQIILKSAHIVNHDEIIEGDIIIEDGFIRKIGKNISTFGDNIRVINCEGKYVMPGGIDVNTHFLGKSNKAVSIEDFYSGTASAISGGTTTIIDTVDIDNENVSLVGRFNEIREKADFHVCCDYGLHVEIKSFNDKVIYEMKTLVNECGVNSFKIDLRDENCNLHDDRNLYDLFKISKRNGTIILVNVANGRIIHKKATDIYKLGITGPEGHRYSNNEELESDSVHHIITISNEANCPVLLTNVMGQSAAELIANAKSKNSVVYGEIITASLAVDGMHCPERSWNHAAACITDPPLSQDMYTAQRLIQHLSTGGMDIISSNHCKFTNLNKQMGLEDFRKIPTGITGVTERMMIVWDKGVNTGIFDACQFVAVTSANAAKLFNVYPRKGAIKEGSDADIVIWDPKAIRKMSADDNKSKSCVNIFENLSCSGAPHIVISNGRVVYDNKTLRVKAGSGRFLKLHPNSQYVYKKVSLKDKLYSQSLRQILRDPVEIKSEEDLKIEEAQNNNNGHDSQAEVPKINQRATTRCGGRNMQDSTFSLSGCQIDDNKPIRSSIRAQQPPGGVSTFPW